MCGIAGIAASDPVLLEPIGAMTRALRHRGPDDEGYALGDSRQGGVRAFSGPDSIPEIQHPRLPAVIPGGSDLALGHRRLAIIDLSPGGHGPMSSADGRLWITYNGEIYNYLELRQELRALGHGFRTESDTEVILEAYAAWGRDCLRRFNGMWAFALYDARQKQLFCARDRFGVKPFHYYRDDSLFAFASEIKGLLAHPRVPREPDPASVAGFLARGALDESEQTFVRGVLALPAAHALTLDLRTRRVSVERYYGLPEPAERPLAADAFRALLEDAVRLRLRSDVDVGTCLSGGLDSSSLVALTAKLRDASAGALHKSFSVVYDDPGLREGPFIDAVIAATGVHGSRTSASSADLLRDAEALAAAQDEPIPSTGPYSHWRVMALAHQAGIKVLLDGQGADETLAGYHYHFGPFLAELAARHGLGRAFREASAGASVTNRSLGFFLGLLAYHALPWPEALREKTIGRFATHGYLPMDALEPQALAQIGRLPGARHVRRVTLESERRANLVATSLPALLRYEDRNSMAFSIEARTPFLDYRLVEAALALPAAQLIADGWTKHILREAMKGVLPESVRLRRDKLGFSTPETRWLTEIAPRVREWLAAPSYVSTLVRPEMLRGWLALSDAQLARRRGLWRLVSLELWHRHLVSYRAPAA